MNTGNWHPAKNSQSPARKEAQKLQKSSPNLYRQLRNIFNFGRNPIISYDTVELKDKDTSGLTVYHFPFALFKSDTSELLVDYEKEGRSAAIKTVKDAEKPDKYSPAITAAEAFARVGVVAGLIMTPDTISVQGGTVSEHMPALNGIAHIAVFFRGDAVVKPSASIK